MFRSATFETGNFRYGIKPNLSAHRNPAMLGHLKHLKKLTVRVELNQLEKTPLNSKLPLRYAFSAQGGEVVGRNRPKYHGRNRRRSKLAMRQPLKRWQATPSPPQRPAA